VSLLRQSTAFILVDLSHETGREEREEGSSLDVNHRNFWNPRVIARVCGRSDRIYRCVVVFLVSTSDVGGHPDDAAH